MKDQLRNVFLTIGLGTLIFVPMLIIDNGLDDSMKSVLIWLGASILYGMSFSILELKTIFRIPLHFAACFAITFAVRVGYAYFTRAAVLVSPPAALLSAVLELLVLPQDANIVAQSAVLATIAINFLTFIVFSSLDTNRYVSFLVKLRS